MVKKIENETNKTPQDHEDDMIVRVFKKLSLVKGDDRMALIVGHGFIELLVSVLAKEKTKNGKKIKNDSRSFPHSVKLLILHEIGTITDSQYESYDWLRRLRNKAAHEPIFEITPETYKQCPVVRLDGKNEDFHGFITTIIGSLWNEHKDIFGPKFAPTVMGLNKK